MSQEHALNFDHWKKLSKNYKPMSVWICLVYKIYQELLSLATFLWDHSNSRGIPPLLTK